jgi:hypothetical protein
VVGQKLSDVGTSVIIENKAGAAGVIVADHVAKQPGIAPLMAHINSHALALALASLATTRSDFSPQSAWWHHTEHSWSATLTSLQNRWLMWWKLCKAKPDRSVLRRQGAWVWPSSISRWKMFKLQAKIFASFPPRLRPGTQDLIGGQ